MTAVLYSPETMDRLAAAHPERIEQAHGNAQLAVWLYEVDRHLAKRLGGLGHRDMPDRYWADEWESGTTARDAALDAICDWHDEGDFA